MVGAARSGDSRRREHACGGTARSRERTGSGRGSGGGPDPWRALVVLLAVSTIAAGTTILVTGRATAAGPTTLSGTTSADAAASCWEIKQLYPDQCRRRLLVAER